RVLELLDLHFLGLERAIGAYLVETDDGPALHDCGPATTLPQLEQSLHELGIELTDIRHLLLSHIHFDHAGAAGLLVQRDPELTVWVSEVGAPHLVDPSRLEASARRVYGETFDRFWGSAVPLPGRDIPLRQGAPAGWGRGLGAAALRRDVRPLRGLARTHPGAEHPAGRGRRGRLGGLPRPGSREPPRRVLPRRRAARGRRLRRAPPALVLRGAADA